jgi:hypothetical protein
VKNPAGGRKRLPDDGLPARRHGKNWYLAAIADRNARELPVPLPDVPPEATFNPAIPKPPAAWLWR